MRNPFKRRKVGPDGWIPVMMNGHVHPVPYYRGRPTYFGANCFSVATIGAMTGTVKEAK